MPACCHEGCNASFPEAKTLISHLKFQHHYVRYVNATKCVECDRKFSSYCSLSKHYLRCPSNKNQHIFHDPEPSDLPLSDVEGLNFVEVEKNSVVPGAPPNLDIKKFMLQQSAAFCAKLYSKVNVPRNYIQLIVENSTELFSSIAEFLDCKLEILVNPDVMSSEVRPLLEAVSKPFVSLETEWQRFEYYKNNGSYIPPEKIYLGDRREVRMVKCESSPIGRAKFQKQIVYVACHEQFISPKRILFKFFNSPDVLNTVLNYQKTLLQSEGMYENFIQADYWKNFLAKKRLKADETVIPLCVFVDDFEVGNIVGSHSGVHKLGGVYLYIPTIPPEYRSTLQCIFLTLLFHSSDRNCFKNDVIFTPLLNVLIELSRDGLGFDNAGFKGTIFFQLAYLLGDNLGIHQLLGFNESFVSKHPCRICSIDKNHMHSQCVEDEHLIRTIESYDRSLELNNPSETGIKSECVWNRVPGFHAVTSVAVDLMHDLLEGVCHYDFTEILYEFIFVQKYFDVHSFNSRITTFDYGLRDSLNLPPAQDRQNLAKKTIRMTASEMLTFTTYFGIIFSDLIPQDNQHWHLYISLRSVLSLVLQRQIQPGCEALLKSLVEEHNQLYIDCSKGTLKNKFHHLVHYPRFLRLFGSFTDMWVMRLEAKHKVLKLAATSVPNRINICKTVAVRNQLIFNWSCISDSFFSDLVEYSAIHSLASVRDILGDKSIENCLLLDQKFSRCDTAQIHGTKYRIGMVINYDIYDFQPQFYVITEVLVYKSSKIHFIAEKLINNYYDDHCAAYFVKKSGNLAFINQSDLMNHKPLSLSKGSDGRLLIATMGI